ncbi:uncharacterized protein PAC_08143 [Phialocephala subalpina]|uniref:MYND-type domain-containing protein n=1 Tax=Phialocephala subalpina TaxID=576137 RepID=A0A1L7WZR4_9HELO|nr:uncharacterized protein PAC_08143 [Phialocephala subalpina]
MDPEVRRQILGSKPASVNQVRLHVFGIDSDSDEVTGTPSMNDIIHPDASPELQALTFAQRESIYHESRGHDGCYKAILLYQHLFDLCPAGQKLSIQIKNEAPVLVDPSARKILEFKMNGPKLLTISTGLKGKDGAILTGLGQESSHSVLGFSCRGSGVVDFVVDMTRMQWGEAGRGSFGETCYLGTEAGFVDIMANVCDGVKEVGHDATHVGPSEHTMTMEACATRVWERWNNRDKEGWCDYCGVGASEWPLLDCSACKETKLRYCCKEHQRAAWKLHKFTCEKKKT